jgi:hypothetical protein
MWHFGSGVGHINNTVVRFQAVDALSDMDIDSEEEPVGDSINDLDENVEKDDEMAAESENDDLAGDTEDLDLDSPDEMLNDEEAMGSDDDGYASL